MSEEAVTFSGGADGATCLDNVCGGIQNGQRNILVTQYNIFLTNTVFYANKTQDQ